MDNEKQASDLSSGTSETNEHVLPHEDAFIRETAEEKANFEQRVSEAVQRQLASFFAAFDNHQQPSSSRYVQPTFQIPIYTKEEKLQGSSNFQAWRSKLETGLQSQNLLIYVQHEEGDSTVSEELRKIRDAQALQYINATVSTEIGMSLFRSKTAYAAFRLLAITYGDQKLSENIRLERRQRRLFFRPWHDAIRFVNDFENIIADYKAIGTDFDDEPLIAKFLAMLDVETGGADNPYKVFSTIVQSLPKEFRTFETIKSRFLNFAPKLKKPESSDKRSTDKRPQKNDGLFQKRSSSSFRDMPPSTASKKIKRTISDLVDGKSKVSLEDLYSLEQRTRLSKMSSTEKAANRCKTCNIFFHNADNCPYQAKLCLNCFHFGHAQNECKEGEVTNTLCSGFSSLTMCKNNTQQTVTNSFNIIAFFSIELNFIVDSGATHHAVSDITLIHHFKPYVNPRQVTLAITEEISYSRGYGSIPILLCFQNSYHILKLHEVQLVDNLEDPISSVQAFNNQFNTSIMLNTNDGIIIYRAENQESEEIKPLARINKHELFQLSTLTSQSSQSDELFSNLYPDKCTYSQSQDNKSFIKIASYKSKSKRTKCTKISPKKLELLKTEGEFWHNRLGHISAPYLNRLKYSSIGTTDFVFNSTLSDCQICSHAKMTRKTFDKDREGASHPCQIIHADLITISIPTFIKGNKYILTALDDYTCYLQTFVIKNKTDVPECLNQIHTNMGLEALHKNIKYNYLDGTRCIRLDKTIYALMRLIQEKEFERVIKFAKQKPSKKLPMIKQSHEISIECDSNVEKLSEEKWSVRSSTNSTQHYQVSRVKFEPCCVHICKKCRICSHMVQCSCYDYSVKQNICKHAVMRSQLKENNANDESQEEFQDIVYHPIVEENDNSSMRLEWDQLQSNDELDREKQEKDRLLARWSAILGALENATLSSEQRSKISKYFDAISATISSVSKEKTQPRINSRKKIVKQTFFSTKKCKEKKVFIPPSSQNSALRRI